MNKFESNVLHFYGERGKAWLKELPQVIQDCARRYGLSELLPFPNLTHNYVLFGLQAVRPIVLKIGIEPAFLKREACTLEAYNGFGAVKLLAKDNGILLLERAIPGGSLKSFFPKEDKEAVHIVCNLMHRLHKAPLPDNIAMPSMHKWLAPLNRDWPIPTHHLHKARQLSDQLLGTSADPVLLHGDLHHDNILQQGHEWFAIDPKGLIGEPAFEIAAFIRNPIPELLTLSEPQKTISNRIALFGKILKLPANRILNWCFVQAVLCWAWSIEDRGHPAIKSSGTGSSAAKYFMQLTEILYNIN